MKRSKMKRKTRKTMNKSGKKPCQICNEPNILQTHHIYGRKIPNYNHSSNLADVCGSCHDKIHWGHIIIEKWTMTTNGMELLWHKKDEESFSGEDSSPHIIKS